MADAKTKQKLVDFIQDHTSGGSIESRIALSGSHATTWQDRKKVLQGFYDDVIATKEMKGLEDEPNRFIVRKKAEDGTWGPRTLYNPIGPDKGDLFDSKIMAESIGAGTGTAIGLLGTKTPHGALLWGVAGEEFGRQAHQAVSEYLRGEDQSDPIGSMIGRGYQNIGDIALSYGLGGVGEIFAQGMKPVMRGLQNVSKYAVDKFGGGTDKLQENIGLLQETDETLGQLRKNDPNVGSSDTTDIGLINERGEPGIMTLGTGLDSDTLMNVESAQRSLYATTQKYGDAVDEYFEMGRKAGQELARNNTAFNQRRGGDIARNQFDIQTYQPSGAKPFDDLNQRKLTEFENDPIAFINNPQDIHLFTSAIEEGQALNLPIDDSVMDLYNLVKTDPPPIPATGMTREQGEMGDKIIRHGLEQADARNQRISNYLYGISDELNSGKTAYIPNTRKLHAQIADRRARFPATEGDITGEAMKRVDKVLNDSQVRSFEMPDGTFEYLTINELYDHIAGMGLNNSQIQSIVNSGQPFFDLYGDPSYRIPLMKLQEIRTFVRQEHMKSGDVESLRDKELLGVYNALTKDIEEGTKSIAFDANGNLKPDADITGYEAWKRANDFYAESQNPNVLLGGRRPFQNQNFGQDFLDRLKSQKTGEALYNFVMQGTKSGAGNLPNALKLLPYDSQEALKSSLIFQLGWNKNRWSPRTFVTNTSTTNMSDATKNILFAPTPDGVDRMAAFENFRTFLENMNISDAFLNTSNTGISVQMLGASLLTAFSGGGAGAGYFVGGDLLSAGVGMALGAAGYIGLNRSIAGLLTSKKFMNFLNKKIPLIKSAKDNPIPRILGQASAIFIDDPQIQEGIGALREVFQTLSNNPDEFFGLADEYEPSTRATLGQRRVQQERDLEGSMYDFYEEIGVIDPNNPQREGIGVLP